jgi:diadenosine tetraphosphate (Ap4A) HIT family hydrolase
MATPAECYSCTQSAAGSSAPPWERIAGDEYWRVAHAFNTAVPGWLVLIPRRHVTALAELTAAEAATLGSWQVQLSLALGRALGCQKTYVAQFAEADGFAHVHFHIVPRLPDLAGDLRGPRIFRLLGVPDEEQVGDDEMNRLATELAAQLGPQR